MLHTTDGVEFDPRTHTVLSAEPAPVGGGTRVRTVAGEFDLVESPAIVALALGPPDALPGLVER